MTKTNKLIILVGCLMAFHTGCAPGCTSEATKVGNPNVSPTVTTEQFLTQNPTWTGVTDDASAYPVYSLEFDTAAGTVTIRLYSNKTDDVPVVLVVANYTVQTDGSITVSTTDGSVSFELSLSNDNLAVVIIIDSARHKTTELAFSNQSAFMALVARHTSEARDQYCGVYDADATDAKAALGCALTRFIGIFESDPIQTLLLNTGESPLNIDDAVFDGDGLFSILNGDAELAFEQFQFLPYIARLYRSRNEGRASGGYKDDHAQFVDEILVILRDHAFAPSDIQSNIAALVSTLDDIHEMLLVPYAVDRFTTVIPKEFFHIDEDIAVVGHDVAAFDLIVMSMSFVIQVAEAYETSTIQYDDILIGGRVSNAELADSLNGLNGDPMLGTLKVEGSKLVHLILLFHSILNRAQTVLDGLQDTSPTEYVDQFTRDYPAELVKARHVVEDFRQSMGDEFVRLRIFDESGSDSIVSVNMFQFFHNPPDARRVTDVYPIDYYENRWTDRNGQDRFYSEVGLVETFWKRFLEGMLRWEERR